ncbi:type VI secretion system baseplate subunit TssF [Candidatus Uabimicrobium amorphum]|uniref:Type VI secretion protein n=1 Tax=Uabimicrobium amorphum TaxID=2596890 RepID=A0A5S9IRA3_UABAM|nr:type VI secretion system baseplate subunit TssF [Candidatus Uabimicrobium amorphum]BBM86668.1 type VI secretion protein [Candidatus Uabimicrobium amorphum]
MDDDSKKFFDQELGALKKFLNQHRKVDVNILQDPDAKRIIEAMAFFNARIMQASSENIMNTQLRLALQMFPFLFIPIPAMGILRCKTTLNLRDSILLSKGSEVLATPLFTRKSAPGATFYTVMDLKIQPISLKSISKAPQELQLHFAAFYPRNGNIGKLSICIQKFDDYANSLYIFQHLKKAISVEIRFRNEQGLSEWLVCDVSYGLSQETHHLMDSDLNHPVYQMRSFLHYPEIELYIHFEVNANSEEGIPRNWQYFDIKMEFEEPLPENFHEHVSDEIFQLFTVPIANLKKDTAKTIVCDGTKNYYPIRSIDSTYSIHSVLGVYEVTSDGLEVLRPAFIRSGINSYEVEYFGQFKGQISFNMPDSIAHPRQIVVEALWFQPEFSENVQQRLKIEMHNKKLEGVTCELIDTIHPHYDSSIVEDYDLLLQLLFLGKNRYLKPSQQLSLIKSLKIFKNSHFEKIVEAFEKLDITTCPDALHGRKRIYHLQIKKLEEKEQIILEIFLQRLVLVLNDSTNEPAELRAQLGSSILYIDQRGIIANYEQ